MKTSIGLLLIIPGLLLIIPKANSSEVNTLILSSEDSKAKDSEGSSGEGSSDEGSSDEEPWKHHIDDNSRPALTN
jgi:hypothetical protein